MLKTIVTDIYDFPTLIHDRNVYVDKTALLHRLISKVDGTLFFMSRPRRFGKSLKQCHDRNYAAPYATDKRKVVYIGVNYSPKSATVETLTGEVKQACGEVNGEVKSYIVHHPGCRRREICESLQMSPRTLDRKLANLVLRGAIAFRGAPKTGGYFALEGATK